MSKITFRADDELVDAIEALDASKSEVMREALREYLGVDSSGPEAIGHYPVEESLEEIVARQVERVLDDRLADRQARDNEITLRVELADESDRPATATDATTARRPSTSDADHGRRTGTRGGRCAQCGADLDPEHAYCPNCGEHAAPSFYCECGTELSREWSFCPTCGRRTASPETPEP
ncbi:MAG: zinc ribbon domain-containing protein [Halanaeroarchaeum sp.]